MLSHKLQNMIATVPAWKKADVGVIVFEQPSTLIMNMTSQAELSNCQGQEDTSS